MAAPRFNTRLRLRTAALHRRAEAPLQAMLRARRAPGTSAAAAWLRAEALRHAALDRAVARTPAARAFVPPALRRGAGLAAWAAAAPPPDPADAAAARRLAAQFRARLARGTASVPVQAYVFGLAHLYGGRILGVLVGRAIGAAAPPDAAGMTLDPKLRRALDRLARDPAMRARLLPEAAWAYAHGGALVRLLTRV